MRALVKARPEVGLWMQDVPVPGIGPNDVLIRIVKSSICGTDVHIWNWDHWAQQHIALGMHVGHEYVGRIAALGSAVTGYEVGERVTGEGHIVCGHCRRCRAGQRHLCKETIGVGVNRPGLLRRVPRAAGEQPLPGARGRPRRDRHDLRPVRQRHAHRAELRHGRRGRPDHRRRADRRDGRGDRRARRRPQRDRHRRQPLPPRAGAGHGRDPRGGRRARRPRAR